MLDRLRMLLLLSAAFCLPLAQAQDGTDAGNGDATHGETGFVGPPALVPAGDPASAHFIGPVLVGPFEILGASVLPGKRARLEWNAGMSFSGGEVVSPVVVVHGVRPGPVLCLTAGVHGDELNGVEIARRVVNEVEPGDLGGTLVAVPIVNLFGFSRNSRY
ncbi:MAG: succinylglutamate desuccinylase/aspartoacylase family protein, partial [Gammaproteobacteria bacterium]|nr:succinylglutamate desuccinylase/aspartoacylase family protein [Gammaproteobacteria bacterium]